ncbi:hypothetical protein [Hyphomonas adhaerens]|nr:hypothetical protein [Hyphomonas adhaerens]
MKHLTWDMDFRPEADREKIFGGLVEGRECGDCSACCTHLTIRTPEFQKPEGIACEHCANPGCGIYEERFPVCREWQCLWKHIGAMPEEARPDKLKIIFSLQRPNDPPHPFAKLYIGGWAFDGVEAYGTELGRNLIAMFSQGDLPVWLSTPDGLGHLVHPEPNIVDMVTERQKPKNKTERKEAKAWAAGIKRQL